MNLKPSDLKSFEGDVAILDLANGTQVMTTVQSVGTDSITCRNILMLRLDLAPRNPTEQPGPNNPLDMRVNLPPYGYPMSLPKVVNIDLAHVVFVLKPMDQIKAAYIKATSSLIVAPSGVLDALPPVGQFKP